LITSLLSFLSSKPIENKRDSKESVCRDTGTTKETNLTKEWGGLKSDGGGTLSGFAIASPLSVGLLPKNSPGPPGRRDGVGAA
jgi:hypothetical protein